MKNNRKRFLSLLLVLVMVIALMPAGHVHAASQVATAAATDLGLANVGDSAKFVIVSAVSPSLEMVANVGTNGSGQTGFELAFEDYPRALEQGKFDLYLGEVVLTADFDLSGHSFLSFHFNLSQ